MKFFPIACLALGAFASVDECSVCTFLVGNIQKLAQADASHNRLSYLVPQLCQTLVNERELCLEQASEMTLYMQQFAHSPTLAQDVCNNLEVCGTHPFSAGNGGACNNPQDRAAVASSFGAFRDKMSSCAHSHYGEATKVKACLQESFPYSDGCATCFGQTAQCARDKCLLPCLPGDTRPKCLSCVETKCIPSLVDCTGLSKDELPN